MASSPQHEAWDTESHCMLSPAQQTEPFPVSAKHTLTSYPLTFNLFCDIFPLQRGKVEMGGLAGKQRLWLPPAAAAGDCTSKVRSRLTGLSCFAPGTESKEQGTALNHRVKHSMTL